MLRDSGNLPRIQSYAPLALQHLDDLCQSLALTSLAASEAHWILGSTCKAAALPGQQYVGTRQLHSSASRSLAAFATTHAGHASTAQIDQSPLRDKVRSSTCCYLAFTHQALLHASSLQIRTLKLKMTKPQHLSYLLLQLRSLAQASMHNEASTQAALLEHTAGIDAMLDKYPALCSHIVLSVACLSFAHLCQRAETLGVTADESTISTVHRLLHLFVAQRDVAGNRQVGNVLWALVRLKISPDSVGPSYEAALAEMFLATMHECTMENVGNMLWVMGMLNSNPLSGSLLDSLIKRLQVCLSEPNVDCMGEKQVQSTHLALPICQHSCARREVL